MERSRDSFEKLGIPFLYIIFAVGIAGHLINFTNGLMLLLTPYTLLICAVVVLYPFITNKNYKILIWILLTYLFTFIIEVIGVKTALVFGSYDYGGVLGLKIFDVPVIIGLNWVFVILGAIFISELIIKNIYFSSLLTALFAVLFDYFLEPVAIYLDYWSWSSEAVPLQNYIAWFIIAFIFAFVFGKLKLKTENVLPVHYFIVQIIFFLSLNVFLVKG
jgi:putative membrane protein